MDKIIIRELEVFAHHGVYAKEKQYGQLFYVNCELELDLRRAGRSDFLEDSIDYGTICHMITEKMTEKSYDLIEKVAEILAEMLLKYDNRIRKVTLELRKPYAPIGLELQSVSVKIERSWHTAYLALGSNMGEKEAYLKEAVKKLERHPDCHVQKLSTFIETEPYGVREQDVFLNGALQLQTLLTPYELLDELHLIEAEAGRERTLHWGPRTLDLDILFYDQEIISDTQLCVPHVDMKNRDFVLIPMAEIAPYFRHPVYGKTMTELLAELKEKS